MLIRIPLERPPSDKDERPESVRELAALASTYTTGRALPHQQAFVDWYASNSERFTCQIQFEQGDDCNRHFSFAAFHYSLKGCVSEEGITVSVCYQGEYCDLVFDADACASPVPGGYVCTFCEPELKVIFADELEMWKDHVFEPLLKWVNEDLAESNWLVLEGDPRFTSARLMTEHPAPDQDLAPDSVRIVIPLKQHEIT